MRRGSPLDPFGVGERVLTALALLWVVAWVAHQVVIWLTPVIPLIIAVALLVTVWTVVFGRRRK